MCTMISSSASIVGSGKGPLGWVRVDQANVGFDHAVHAPLEHAVLIDFVATVSGHAERVAVELDIASARSLVAQLEAVIEEVERSGFAE